MLKCSHEGCTSTVFYEWSGRGGRINVPCKEHEKERGRARYYKFKDKVLKRQKKTYGSIEWAHQRILWFVAWDKRNALPSNRDITASDFLLLHNSSCTYCGDVDKLGIDRVDNSRGHDKANVVPCCKQCNLTRADRFTLEEFMLLAPILKKIRERKSNLRFSALARRLP